ncbi:UNVERIFIED_CONTAM: hypothetical protein RMT77_008625 [Armadillidium vulgare]
MGSNKKVEEALAHIREAEKSLKTGLLKWKPDYDIAADEYNAAATCYKAARQFAQSRDCLLKAAENYKICRSFFSAAKCVEHAALASKEIGDIDSIASLSERAAGLYRNHGVPDTAALALDKGAKMIEGQNVEKALHLYKYAVEIVMTEDRPRQAAEYQCKVSRHLIKLQRYDEAVDSIRQELSFYQQGENTGAMGRLSVGLVLVQLARGDTIAAEKAFREWGGCAEFEEVQTVNSLIQGFDEQDGDMVLKALNSAFIKHMDVEYAKLAKIIPVPKTSEEQKKSKAESSYSHDANESAQQTPEGKHDDEELDLC